MHFLHKIKIVGKNSEGGFVLILALIGIMILMAIGYFALTVSTSDMQVASRIIGERKAMSAAEAGVHAVTSNYDSAPTANNTSADNDCDDAGDWVQVDPNDPHAFYCVRGSAEVPGLSQACSGTFSIEGMGGGDIKLLAMIGGFFGWQSLIFVLLFSSFTGAIIGITAMIIKKQDTKYAVPFGPFLSAAAVAYIFWGEAFMRYLIPVR